MRPLAVGPDPGEELKDLVYDDHREGDEQHSLPLAPSEGGDGEHILR